MFERFERIGHSRCCPNNKVERIRMMAVVGCIDNSDKDLIRELPIFRRQVKMPHRKIVEDGMR